MAKLNGLLKFRGSIGGLTFVQGDHGETYVKEKSGPRKCRMMHGEEFSNSRRAAAEFKTSGQATRTFRNALDSLRYGVEARSLTGRINAWLLRAIRSDQVNDWGYRCMQASDVSLLEGFEFNEGLTLGELMPVNLADRVEVAGQQVRLSIPGFRLRRSDKKLPKQATHFRVVSTMLVIDFDKKTHSRVVKTGELTRIGRKSGSDFVAEHTAAGKPGQLCFWLVGIEFFVMKNDHPVVVRGGVLRCMKVWRMCSENRLQDY